MKWVKALDRLPTERGSYFVKEINSGNKAILFFSPGHTGKGLIARYPEKYLWLEEYPQNSGQVIWDKACHATLKSIANTFLNGENQKKAMLGSDKVVFQAIGETIENFPTPQFPSELDN